jgi:lipopolysaccharide/colanic/teichoic acid biosynthesis glycosyltransferase
MSWLTGYAQIHGWRGYTSVEERLRRGLPFVRNWSLALDARFYDDHSWWVNRLERRSALISNL